LYKYDKFKQPDASHRSVIRSYVRGFEGSFYFGEGKGGGGRKDVTLIQLHRSQLEDYLESALSQHFLRVLRRERTFEFWNDRVGVHSRRRTSRRCFLSKERERERENREVHTPSRGLYDYYRLASVVTCIIFLMACFNVVGW